MKYIQLIYTIIILALITACTGPGHQAAFEQFKSPSTGHILSVQGYVTKNDEQKNNLNTRWNKLAFVMKQQPGFISGYLSLGLGESTLWLAHSEWKNIEALRSAFTNPEVLSMESKMPKTQFEHLFTLDNNVKSPETK